MCPNPRFYPQQNEAIELEALETLPLNFGGLYNTVELPKCFL